MQSSLCPAGVRRRPGSRQALAASIAAALSVAAAPAPAQQPVLSVITVTGTREGQNLEQTPASIGIVGEAAVRLVKPSHPSQILGQVPGVAAGVTNGEGHTTAIRQPFTTAPVYLFLEDGIPIRSTGFFNHNALYEVNLPQAGGLEVNRGPTTALYGSDAIGGAINVLTRTPPKGTEFSLFGEAGSHGWKRILGSAGTGGGDDGWIGNANLTRSGGWRDKTAYERNSLSARWDHAIGDDTLVKTLFSTTRIDQETGANSPLVMADYLDHPTRNYKPIAFRKVSATRLSAAWERESGDTLLSITPYYRDNSMDLLASFKLTSGAAGDNTISYGSNQSYGVQAKWRKDFDERRARLIVGVDLEHSPGARQEDRINVTVSGAGASRVYSAYTVGARVYDYRVAFNGISPYIHGEYSATERLRLSAGLRHDHVGFRFENKIKTATVAATRFYGQSADTSISYDHLSPKFGATFALTPDTHLFGSLNHSFRAPSEGDLFRPSPDTVAARAVLAAQSALTLKPVKGDQAELGLRGRAAGIGYDVVAYELVKTDDILTYTDPLTGVRSSSNNGSTRHRGIEAALGIPLGRAWRADFALSRASHYYKDWVVPNGGVNLSGKEIAAAPRTLANARLSWSPDDTTSLQLEWVHLGAYWLDDANSAKYQGHDLLNLRGGISLGKQMRLSGGITNLADKRYADSAGISAGVPVASPGLPRSFNIGLEAKW
ncbi:MAG: TonB-dependent receptor [Sulfuritalea sp.]|nr:TonB-dependent receptor [Sulfuritalea sp.]